MTPKRLRDRSMIPRYDGPGVVRCPSCSWFRSVPNRATCIAAVVNHMWHSHSVDPQPGWLLARSDARLAELLAAAEDGRTDG